MIEVTMTLGRAEQLRDVLTSGISVVQLVRESVEDDECMNALYGAMLILQSAHGMVDDLIEGVLHE